jgi:hypothetical protein
MRSPEENKLPDNVYMNLLVKNNKEHWDQLIHFLQVAKKNNLMFGDIQDPTNWGAREGFPVFLDLGIDEETHAQYYMKKK